MLGSGSLADVSGMPSNASGLAPGSLTIPAATISLYGYDFVGYTRNAAGTGTIYDAGDSFTFASGDPLTIDLYAKWEAKDIPVSFDVDGGNEAAPAATTLPFGAAAITSDIPSATLTKTGYDFGGWATSAGAAVADYIVGYQTISESLLTMYAVWTPKTNTAYTVKHWQENLGGGTYTEVTADIGNETGTTGTNVPAASYAANTYTGFTHDPSATTWLGGGTEPKVLADGSQVINVYYNSNSYALEYEYTSAAPAGATVLPGIASVEYGETITTIAPVIVVGYTFSGWENGGTPVGATLTMPAENVTLKGEYTPNTNTAYTVRHWLKDVGVPTYSEVTADVQNKTGTTGVTLNTADYPANTYTGFTHDPLATAWIGGGTDPEVLADGSQVIDLYYDRNTYNVTYDYLNTAVGADPLPAGLTGIEYEEIVTTAPAAAAAGYTFSGWSIGGTALGATFIMPAEDTTIEGGFTANGNTAYQIEHYTEDLTGGTYTLVGTDSLTGQTETDVIYVATSRTGFSYDVTQDVWSYGSTQPTIKGDGSLVIELYYTRNSYTVSYEITGVRPAGMSTLPAASSVRYEESVTIAAGATAPGYDFNGYGTTDVSVSAGAFVMPATEVTLRGSFTARTDTTYTVVHKGKDIGANTYSILRTETLSGTTDSTAVYTDRTLTGFSYDETRTQWQDMMALAGRENAQEIQDTLDLRLVGSGSTAEIAGDGSLVIELYYTRNSYTITYQYEGEVPAAANEPAALTREFGEEVVLPRVSAVRGYRFGGFSSSDVVIRDGKFTVPAENVEVSGTWTKTADDNGNGNGNNNNNNNNNATGAANRTTPGAGTTAAPRGAAATGAKAGDSTQIGLFVAVLMISGFGSVLLVVKKRREGSSK